MMSRAIVSRIAVRFLREACTAPPLRHRQHADHVSALFYGSRFYSGALCNGSDTGRARRNYDGEQVARRLPTAVDSSTRAGISTKAVAGISTKAADGSDKMYIVFTCCVCETRAVKGFAKSSYESGVVLVQCPGCKKRHVIADHLGWFGPEKNIEEILAGKGETAKRVADVDIEGLTVEDVTGRSRSDDIKDH